MFINQILTEAPKVGRAFQHVEDLVLLEGSMGANKAISRLSQIASNPQTVRWKWDGKPQVYWGREPDGKFIMVGHNGWLKSNGGGKSNSPQELVKFIMSTGNVSPDQQDERMRFANEYASLWPLFEAATPSDFRGYVYGDLLFMRRPQVKNGVYIFTPNNVTYTVPTTTELGQRISKAIAAVVGHAYFPQFGMGDEQQQPIDDFTPFNKTQGLIVLGPRYAQQPVKIDTKKLQDLQKYVAANKGAIDNFLNDERLAAMKMAGFKGVLYNFNNQMAKSGRTTDLANEFTNWLSSGSKQSAPMQKKINDWIAQNKKGFIATFAVLENLRNVKNQIIDQLDSESGDIQQTTKGEAGGEGYVVYGKTGEPNVKLVPRHRWTPN
jgi:Family of unknown function (DUF6267)